MAYIKEEKYKGIYRVYGKNGPVSPFYRNKILAQAKANRYNKGHIQLDRVPTKGYTVIYLNGVPIAKDTINISYEDAVKKYNSKPTSINNKPTNTNAKPTGKTYKTKDGRVLDNDTYYTYLQNEKRRNANQNKPVESKQTQVNNNIQHTITKTSNNNKSTRVKSTTKPVSISKPVSTTKPFEPDNGRTVEFDKPVKPVKPYEPNKYDVKIRAEVQNISEDQARQELIKIHELSNKGTWWKMSSADKQKELKKISDKINRDKAMDMLYTHKQNNKML